MAHNLNPQNLSSIDHLQKLRCRSLERGYTAFVEACDAAIAWLQDHPESYIMDIPQELYPAGDSDKVLFRSSLMRYFTF